MNKQQEIINMLERCLSRTDSISYKMFENEWRRKLKAVKLGKFTVKSFEINDKVFNNDNFRDNFVYQEFLLPLGKLIRDGQRNWDKEHERLRGGV
jgi:hypothetical protein